MSEKSPIFKIMGLLFVLMILQSLIMITTGQFNRSNPVLSATEDEITSLPGLTFKPNFKQYSGYLAADKVQSRYYHYWFVESQSKPDTDPLMLWLNGGPGCSSMIGLLYELGPISINNANQLVENKFAWNKNANILFLESPVGVGFSYAVNGSIISSDDSTAQENYQALSNFFKKFPQFNNRSLYLAGSSYAGIYVPTLADLVDQDNNMNLRGLVIGNGYFDWQLNRMASMVYARFHGLIGGDQWSSLTSSCCPDGKLGNRGLCDIDYFNTTQECRNKFDLEEEIAGIHGVNPYNIYAKCSNAPGKLERAKRSSKIMQLADDAIANAYVEAIKRHKKQPNTFIWGDSKCTDRSIIAKYLDRNEVRQAIHIPSNLSQPFEVCSDSISPDNYDRQYAFRKGGVAPLFNKLIKSKRNLKFLIYNGDTDSMCTFLASQWFVEALNDKLVADHAPWYIGKQNAGFIKKYEHITLATVKGAGHAVPVQKPAEALQLFQEHILGIAP